MNKRQWAALLGFLLGWLCCVVGFEVTSAIGNICALVTMIFLMAYASRD